MTKEKWEKVTARIGFESAVIINDGFDSHKHCTMQKKIQEHSTGFIRIFSDLNSTCLIVCMYTVFSVQVVFSFQFDTSLLVLCFACQTRIL